ncbi:hypothetical protein QAD02_019651 [Eretmocerus hayati]|uniref:Uncharacterized protein n=1 Tax=Eretmocerus hayati TaxID=131215 RepID=A0ACC2PJU2_9HYME|nr:hypothetical protein QAD02_019651 [Eretmocerus hayati]
MASGFPSKHQRKLGPAPIASFEDLSDEVENNGEVTRMPGILEVATPVTPASSLKTPSTPRIDISRASSSSHHEEDSNSRESTPEKELLAGAVVPEGCTLQLGYKEDTTDLRSSTEELELADPVNEQDRRRESRRMRRQRARDHDETQSERGASIKLSHSERERKDSNCSEIVLLNISGRTSRLSSVGSAGSGVSGAALSVVSATSSRSPSPHKCLLETSFCGSVSTLASGLVESSKLEIDEDHLAKMLLLREEDSTRALMPESVRVPIVAGNIKPNPLDMPRRAGREERKEIFRREVEITKQVLKRVNIEVPIIKNLKNEEEESPSRSERQKPATLDLQNDKRKRSPSSASTSSRGPYSATLDTPKQQRHQKVRDVDGSRTPSPSSVSRKSSFTSLFKNRGGAAGVEESPVYGGGGGSRRQSLTSRLRERADSLRSRSKSRERPAPTSDRSPSGPGTRRTSEVSPRSRSGSVFASTLSLFRRQRKRSAGENSIGEPETDISRTPEPLEKEEVISKQQNDVDRIARVEFTFDQQSSYYTPSYQERKGDVIFISLYGENDEFRNRGVDDEEEEEQEEATLPSESVSIPLDSPTKFHDENDASSPQQTSVTIVHTDATIEHHRKSKTDRSSKISSSSGESARILDGHNRDSHMSQSDSRNSRITFDDTPSVKATTPVSSTPPSEPQTHPVPASTLLTTSSSASSLVTVVGVVTGAPKRSHVPKPRRKSRPPSVRPSEPPPARPDIMAQRNVSKEDGIEVRKEEGGKEKQLLGDGEDGHVIDDERKGLCFEESFEDELPYVPTTLPLEKSVAVPMLPVKQRIQQEVTRTTPIERPRSTTPINPQLLDEYVLHQSRPGSREDRRRAANSATKMRISLPREDSFRQHHRSNSGNATTTTTSSGGSGSLLRPGSAGSGGSFSEFAGRVSGLTKSPSPPPPLPPRAPTTRLTTQVVVPGSGARKVETPKPPANWINFEEIPERRKPPKRIQTVPRIDDDSRHQVGHGHGGGPNSGQYSYVQPEECRCECHGDSRRSGSSRHQTSSLSSSSSSSCAGSRNGRPGPECNGANCQNAASVAANSDRASVISDNSSLECSPSAEQSPDAPHRSVVTSSTSGEVGGGGGLLLGLGSRPFSIDLDVSSNRSSIISQDETEDEHQ